MKNKKLISSFFVILLILLTSNISFAETGVVNTPALRIRAKASKDSEIVTRAYEKEEVEIIGEEGDWYKVTVNGKTGYASKPLITKKENKKSQNTVSNYKVEEEKPKKEETKQEEPAQVAEEQPVDSSKTVIKEDTVARIMPNFGSNEAILLTKDTEISIIRNFNNWTEISINGKKVWVLKSKITVGTPAPAETPATKPEETSKPEEENKAEENKVQENKVAENKVVNNTSTNKVENTTKNNTVANATTNTTIAPTNTNTDTRSTKGIVNVETANVREKASKTAKIVGHLDEDDEVTIVAEEGDWYKITSKKVESGYVSKSLIKVPDVSSRSLSEARQENIEVPEVQTMGKGMEVASFAKQYLGTNYVLGGKTPETGFDCSGYTRYVFKNFGYSLGTVAADQNLVGTEVSRDNLQEGDLILFYNEEKTKIGHTGVYVGNNEFIHAANPERGVVIDNLTTNSYYSTRFVTARRIVE